jgi:hypothetical protein
VTTAERQLSILLRVIAGALFLAALIYAFGPIVSWGKLPGTDFFRQPVFVANSVAKVTILGIACLYASGDVRRRRYLVLLVILAHVVSVAAMTSMLFFADTDAVADRGLPRSRLALGPRPYGAGSPGRRRRALIAGGCTPRPLALLQRKLHGGRGRL